MKNTTGIIQFDTYEPGLQKNDNPGSDVSETIIPVFIIWNISNCYVKKRLWLEQEEKGTILGGSNISVTGTWGVTNEWLRDRDYEKR